MQQGGMPVWAYGAIAGFVLLFILFFVFMLRRSLRAANQKTEDVFAGLTRLGLQPTYRDKAICKFEGQYRGRRVGMMTDGTALMNLARKQMVTGLMAGATGLLGVGGGGGGLLSELKEKRKTRKMEDAMKNAAMVLRWAVVLPLESPVAIEIGRDDDEVGQQLVPGVYATFDEPARMALMSPQVQVALQGARFNLISVQGQKVVMTWAAPMSEYQAAMGSTGAGLTTVSEQALNTLCDLCDALYGPAMPGMMSA